MQKVALMLRRHRPLILNWFKARGQISNGVVEGLNNKAKLTMRKSYGFRSDAEGRTDAAAASPAHPELVQGKRPDLQRRGRRFEQQSQADHAKVLRLQI